MTKKQIPFLKRTDTANIFRMDCCTQKQWWNKFHCRFQKNGTVTKALSPIFLITSCIIITIPSEIIKNSITQFLWCISKIRKQGSECKYNISSLFNPDIKVEYLCYYIKQKPKRCIYESPNILPWPVVFAPKIFWQKKEHQKKKITILSITMWSSTIVLTQPYNN